MYYLPAVALSPLPAAVCVYDLSMLPPHAPSFVAAGVVVHNCEVWQHGDCLSVNERSVPEQYFCFDCSTELLLADGHSKAARDIQVNDMVLDERGQPTPVTGVQHAYQLVLPPDGEEGPAHLVNAGIPALPAVDMYEFGFVDYNLNAAGTATHPPLIVTGDHRMELISNRSVSIVRNARTPRLGIVYMAVWTAASGLPARGAGSDIPNEQQPPDAYLRGPHPLQSWPYEKTRMVNVQRTQANPAGATVQELEEDKARARREAWQAHNIRSPFFWRPTAVTMTATWGGASTCTGTATRSTLPLARRWCATTTTSGPVHGRRTSHRLYRATMASFSTTANHHRCCLPTPSHRSLALNLCSAFLPSTSV